jgi:class 3 adenylate cyclase
MATSDGTGVLGGVIDALSMTEIIRLQNQLSRELTRRFERTLALAFSDIVGSTPYFERYGDEAGRQLQQRHFDLLHRATEPVGGRIVDTAGDGAFLVFPSAEAAASALIALQNQISVDNAGRPREHQLDVRLGFHVGAVLTDGVQVTGEAVNLAARVAASGAPGEIRLTREAFQGLGDVFYRLSSRALGPVALKGVSREVELFALEWRDRTLFPEAIRVRETGQEIPLPLKDTLAFGRLDRNEDGSPANDVVLALPDETETRKISRWHFELRRHPTGLVLRAVSDQLTQVDGETLAKGAEVPVKPGCVVRVGRVMTLEFTSRPVAETLGTTDQRSLLG